VSSTTFVIEAGHPCLDGHFPGAPVVPGVLVLERVIDAVQRDSGRRIIGVRRCKFVAALYPGETCDIEWSADSGAARFVCHGPEGVLARGVLNLEGRQDG